MLKGIPRLLSPELLKILSEMGHGDRIVIADGNFPAESIGKNSIVLRMDGHNIPELLNAILTVFPLDHYVASPTSLMAVVPGDPVETPIWDTYSEIIKKHEPALSTPFATLERFHFYEEAKTAYCIIATGERAQYANIMLQKGVITD